VPRNAGVQALTLSSEQIDEITPKSAEIYKRYFR